jgi:hypothetical protein
MGWDEICALYNINWASLVLDVQNRTAVLAPEKVTVDQINRFDANDPSYFPVQVQPTPIPSGQPLILSSPIEGACP